jgi:gliding motility-associated-like protein
VYICSIISHKIPFKLRYFLLVTFISIIYANVQGQICSGSLGDPLVNVTFGAGSNPGNALAAATTAYQFSSTDCPNDGSYTVRNNTTNCFSSTWHSLASDHTGDANGYFMLVNASIQPSAFFVDTVRGLCSNTIYSFAAWIVNVIKPTACGGNNIKPKINFSIEKLDGTIILTNNTGDINTDLAATWKQYGFFFTTPTGVTDIVLRMTNNASGGCGNDLALDDITFRACGPAISTTIVGIPSGTNAAHCQSINISYNFNCTISAGLTNPSYQWQQSINNGLFVDIAGENNFTLTKTFLPNALTAVYKYRLIVAEMGNINSIFCRTLSTEIVITIYPKPTTTASNIGACQNKTIKLNATGGNNYTWTGPNNFTATAADTSIANTQLINAGKYYVLIKDMNGCTNLDSTTVVIHPTPIAATSFADSTICAGAQITLNASAGTNYEWIPTTFLNDATSATPICKATEDIKYKVVVSNSFNCSDTAYTSIKVIKAATVDAGADIVTIANKNIKLQGNITGDFLRYTWSPMEFINSVNILSPTVYPPTDKKYYLTVYTGCGSFADSVSIKIYNGIFIPNTFTPNADTKNDTWNIPALEAYPMHELKVYNRYGQIVFERKQSFTSWDGKFAGEPQPTGVYIYIIDLKNGTAAIKGTLLLSK